MWSAVRQTLVLRGLITMAFGLLLMVWPTVCLDVLVLLFGVFALVDGSLIVTTAVLAPRDEPGRVAALVSGFLAVLVGLVTFVWPGLTRLVLLVLIAVRALVIGVAEAATATYLERHALSDRAAVWMLGGVGVISISFGVLLLVFPAAGLVALVWAIGLYAALVGLTLIARAWVLTVSTETV